MAAAIRYAMRHSGLTGTNPSVATLIVRDDGQGPRIVGRGITALGGRPHAEAKALSEAGEKARGATAYVTLEPCAHHGRTPPCAEALVAAGVARVVSAAADPDPRVDGKGHAILQAGGLAVRPRVMAREAASDLAPYLARHAKGRPHVTLKFAMSSDGCIGREGSGQVFITGPTANRQTHLVRARTDAILVGMGTVTEDDPSLECRLPGLAERSPRRIILDPDLRMEPGLQLVRTARRTRTTLVTRADADRAKRVALSDAGIDFVACAMVPGTTRVALPELFEDLGAMGLQSVLVEGGASVAASFLEAGLVDRLILVVGDLEIGPGGIAAPILFAEACERFHLRERLRFGADRWFEFESRN
ncbi:bifunctional diaminohydroxyphosphoribosylaminopyrimidine deaminase/5-amino-6-(5-phosphoribosylamino)uracil reductase RibD [Fulvimarina sp. 2208YS6-2-32]|uniref:Riboflavin biosynthesis protein RibD n=2 Tax=Fulvimarina uroteuthidis TaxID=3098149 RepID=A0ABU5I2K4_9HYPH|nr:bifunctional diaminohydroxyphosphoribosylaminopyrimidine deaminase/5-amino-6-(5-phosphoribosylamino)uracil reductase RibD [Fulvimarina sp. 2208YS6-2-32]MDY8109603.1 bifunctional diaminohydroxyphosphoribosylaminopyrimidine deaminase/5-amino-6-(5-phosphoribosylamino)uracil reductase RibD [Fulvimarina sp. 2208YS6-2-32]